MIRPMTTKTKRAPRHEWDWEDTRPGDVIEVYQIGQDPTNPGTLPCYDGLVKVISPDIGAVSMKGDYQQLRVGTERPIAIVEGATAKDWGKLL